MAGFIGGTFALDSDLFTTSSGNNNDINLNSSLFYVDTTNNNDAITGIQYNQNQGWLILVVNTNATNLLVIKNNDSNSESTNRILTATGDDLTIPPFNTAILGYDTTGQQWHIIEVPKLTKQASQSRSINGTGFQVSTIRNAEVKYCVQIASALSLTGGQTGNVFLEISPNNSSWTEITRFVNGNTGTLALGLNTTQTISSQLNGFVPRGYYARLRQTSTGAPTITFISGQEILY